MANIRTALVIGGGIAGPVAATALRKVGIEATVYEAAYPPAAGELGGSLGPASNGVAALEIIGAADAVRALATPTPNMLMTIRGKKAVQGAAFPRRPGAPQNLSPVGALHIMPPVPHFHRGRMVLAGAAVHAPSNSTGQGASLAIESAIELARNPA
ncbi:MAG: NAD(P)-binding protein [Streptosporangiaceae bacterium]